MKENRNINRKYRILQKKDKRARKRESENNLFRAVRSK